MNDKPKVHIYFGGQRFGISGSPYAQPTREQLLENENRELKRILEDVQAVPGMFASVIEVEEKYVTVCTGPQILSLKKPYALEGLAVGKVVRLSAIENQPPNIIKVLDEPPATGISVEVMQVIDDTTLEISQGPMTRIVYYDKKKLKVEAGDKVGLDFTERVAVRNLGKGNQKQVFAEETGIAWDDIGGLEEAKRELIEAIEEPIRFKDLYKRYGRVPTRGVLLHGPPGTGKTMLGKAAATALAKAHGAAAKRGGFLYVKGPEILNMFVGNSEANIRKLFASAREYKEQTGYPAIVFIDEADAIMAKRGQRQGIEGMERTLVPQFLAEMDGLEDAGCMVLLATNRPDTLDPAVVRVGRVDTKIFVRRPNLEEAKKIFTLYLKNAPLAKGTSLEDVVTTAAEKLFSDANALLMVRCKDAKEDRRFALKELVSGALIMGVTQKALQRALRRERLGESPKGLTGDDCVETVKAMTTEYRSLDHAAAIEEFIETHKLQKIATHIEKVSA